MDRWNGRLGPFLSLVQIFSNALVSLAPGLQPEPYQRHPRLEPFRCDGSKV